ncbi:hypothetical protein JOM56_010330 [Amanita muscaria]
MMLSQFQFRRCKPLICLYILKTRIALPPTVSDILADPSRVRTRYPRSRVSPSLFSRLLGRTHPDTPSASFYRLYEFLVLGWNIKFRDELEYFCRSHPDWAISSIPEPMDDANPDPVRGAILAVLTQLMCDAFNRRIQYGLPRDAPPIVTDFDELAARPKVFEETPEWAKRVKPLDGRFYIPNRDGKLLNWNDEDVSEEFKAMNIIVQAPHIHFI